tara:strand:+ start:528 stop:779 length:252 start_codon:yes stop_codon:yes gene_type:complete
MKTKLLKKLRAKIQLISDLDYVVFNTYSNKLFIHRSEGIAIDTRRAEILKQARKGRKRLEARCIDILCMATGLTIGGIISNYI